MGKARVFSGEYVLDAGLLLGVIAAVIAGAGIVVAVIAWFFPRRPRGEAALHRQQRKEAQLEVYGTLQQICETLEVMAPKPMGIVVGVYQGAEQGLIEAERNALWNKGALPSVRLSDEELARIERLLEEKRSFLEDSTVDAWRNVWQRHVYGSGGGTGACHDLELTSFRKFCAKVGTNYERLKKQVGT